ncbi:MAG: hypothetical protein AABW88_03345 [Nanoarchaeota archaeon]
MLHAKKPAEVRADLEALLRLAPQENLSLFNIDIDFFMMYFDVFGPEQETIALNEVGSMLSALDSINYQTLFAHHTNEADFKTYRNHFLAASFGKKDPFEKGQEIKKALESLEIPIYDIKDSKYKPTERKAEDGRIVVIDPKKITVHMGTSRYAGYNPNVSDLMNLVMEAEEQSKAAESRIVILP